MAREMTGQFVATAPRVRTTLHCQRLPGWVAAALSKLGSAWVKLVDPPAGSDPFPGLHKDVRIWTDGWDRACLERGAAGAEEYMERMLPLWAAYSAWAGVAFELPNEPPCNDPRALACLNAFTERCLAIAEANRLRLIVLNLPEGNPHDDGSGAEAVTRAKAEMLTGCVAAAAKGNHLVGLHGYWRPGVEVPSGRYHALRCVDLVRWWVDAGVESSRLRVALTEWGVDGGIAGNESIHGWRDLLCQDEYVAQVVEGEAALRRLPYVEFAALFTAGPHAPWWSYEQDEDTVCRIAAALATLPAEQTVRLWRRQTGAVEVKCLEEYVRGVVPAEMYASWPHAALQAQAVAARTYATRAVVSPRHGSRGADVCDSTCCQVWRAATDARTDAAVGETAGQVWPDGDGSYVAECGREDCPHCQGRPGSNGQRYAGRLCQYGAKALAEAGSDYVGILQHYYGGFAETAVYTGVEVEMAAEYPELVAYAWDGSRTTVEALRAVYGFEIRRAAKSSGEVFRLTAIRERHGDCSQVARLLCAGRPEEGRYLAWHWPGGSSADLPAQAIAGQWEDHYQIVGPTDGDGKVGPGMGAGAYHAAGTPGPHAMWVASPSAASDAVYGLGMIAGTAHHHVDLEWTLVTEPAAPAGEDAAAMPEPAGGDVTALRWHAEETVRQLEAVQAAIEQARLRLVEHVIEPAYALERSEE